MLSVPCGKQKTHSEPGRRCRRCCLGSCGLRTPRTLIGSLGNISIGDSVCVMGYVHFFKECVRVPSRVRHFPEVCSQNVQPERHSLAQWGRSVLLCRGQAKPNSSASCFLSTKAGSASGSRYGKNMLICFRETFLKPDPLFMSNVGRPNLWRAHFVTQCGYCSSGVKGCRGCTNIYVADASVDDYMDLSLNSAATTEIESNPALPANSPLVMWWEQVSARAKIACILSFQHETSHQVVFVRFSGRQSYDEVSIYPGSLFYPGQRVLAARMWEGGSC